MSKTMIVCLIIIGLCNVVILVSQAIAYKEEKKLKKIQEEMKSCKHSQKTF